MNESKPENILQLEKQKIVYQELMEYAEKLADLADLFDGTLQAFHSEILSRFKFPHPPGNPIRRAYISVMELATDARLGSCQYAQKEENRNAEQRALEAELAEASHL